MASRIGKMAVVAVLLGAIYLYGCRNIVFADGNRVRAAPKAGVPLRTESLTLVDIIDFKKWLPDTLAVSPDGTRIAYALLEGYGRGRIVVDGKAGNEYPGMVGKPVFSPDSRRVAYVAMDADNYWFVVADGVESKDKHPSVRGKSGVSDVLHFSPDGRRLAYVVFVDEGREVKQALVVDHQEVARYDEIARVVLSKNGERLAYSARTGNQWAVVVDGRESAKHESVLGTTPVLSPDGRHVAYGVKEGRRYFMVVDRKQGRDYDDLGGLVLFSPDSTKVVYSPGVGKRQAVVLNDVELGRYDQVDDQSFVFSSDGKHLAYKARDASGWFVVLDGESGRAYGSVGRPVFTPDGARVAHSACEQCGRGNGKLPAMFVLVGGERIGGDYTGIDDRIRFSPDGSRIGFAAERGPDQFVVVDNKEEKVYAGVMSESLLFSPTGRDLVYAAVNDASRSFVVVSGIEGKEFDSVGPCGKEGRLSQEGKILFDKDGSFRYLALLREKAYLVRNAPQGL